MAAGTLPLPQPFVLATSGLHPAPAPVSPTTNPTNQHTNMHISFVRLLLSIGALLTVCQLAGQGGSPQFTGPYRFGDVAGTASYNYQLDGRDTLPQGPFRFTAADLKDGRGRYYVLDGNYTENQQPTGVWRLEWADITGTGAGEIDQYVYRAPVLGTRHVARGVVGADGPQGSWSLEKGPLAGGRAGGASFTEEAEFAGGVPLRVLRLEGGNSSLLGRFSRDGVAEDVWAIYDDLELVQNWHFTDGRLQRVEVFLDGDTASVAVFTESVNKEVLVNLDARYLELIAAHQAMLGRAQGFSEGPARRLLGEHAALWSEVNDLLATAGATNFAPRFGVRVPHYPLTKPERRRLDELQANLTELDTLATALLDDNAVAALGDSAVASRIERVRALAGPRVAAPRQLVEAYITDYLAYLPRQPFMQFVMGEAAGAELDGEKQSSLELADFSAYLSVALTELRTIADELNHRPDNVRRREVVNALEGQLRYEYSRLDSLVNLQPRRVQKDYNLRNLLAVAREELQAYAAIENTTERQQRAQSTVTCLEDMETLLVTVAELPRLEEEIISLYVNEVWDNHLAVMMREKAKRRLIDAYTDVLLPDIRETLSEGVTCANTAELNRRIARLHVRMRELRIPNTNDLESELRGEKNPDRIYALLGVTTTSK